MDRPWMWYLGLAPGIDWIVAFQSQDEVLGSTAARLTIRRLSKVVVNKERRLQCIPWFPRFFNVIDAASAMEIERSLFVWMSATTEAAGADWNEAWETDKQIVEVTEGEAEAVVRDTAALAKAKAELANSLRKGKLELVK